MGLPTQAIEDGAPKVEQTLLPSLTKLQEESAREGMKVEQEKVEMKLEQEKVEMKLEQEMAKELDRECLDL